MKKVYLLLISCLISLSLYSQSNIPKHGRVAIFNLPESIYRKDVLISVMDSSTRAILPGANISFASEKDTSYFITLMGNTPFKSYTFKDSVEITVKYVGYNSVKQKIKVTPPVRLDILMSAGKMEVGEITVLGKSVAMIIKGDTVRYNASSFKMMEDDPMAELFKALPGVTFRGGNLTFKGKRVERIYIDKNRLFGDEVGSALMNITANDVMNIKFYEEADDWDKLNKIKNAPQKMVADVTTKSKPKVVRKISLSGQYGQTIDKNAENKVDDKYSFAGTALFSREGEMLDVKASNNLSDRERNGRVTDGSLLYSQNKPNKFNLRSESSLGLRSNDIKSSSETNYYASDLYRSRYDFADEDGKKQQLTVNSNNRYDQTLRDKSNLDFRFNFRYSQDKNNSLKNQFSVVNDETINRLNLNSSLKKRDINYFGGIGYKKYLSKLNMTLIGGVTVNIKDNHIDTWRVDTLASSSFKLFVDDYTDGWSRNYSGNIKLSKSFFDQKTSFSLFDNVGYRDEKSKRNSFDVLSNRIDSVNTHNYTMNYISNSAGFHASQKIGRVDLSGTVSWDTKKHRRDEFFPKSYDDLRVFNSPSYSLHYSVNLPNSSSIFGSIKRSSMMLPIEYLRREIDDTNPMLLRAGDPNLRMPINNEIKIEYNLFRRIQSLFLNLTASLTSDYVATKTQFFKEDTYLSKYNYLAKAGTSLYTRENYSSEKKISLAPTYSTRSDFLKSSMRFGIRYEYSSTPFILGDVYDKLNQNDLMLEFYFETLSSTKVKLRIYADVAKGWRDDNTNHSSYFNSDVRWAFLWQFLKYYRFGTTVGYAYQKDARANVEYDNVLLSMNLGRKIGKTKPVNIVVMVNDILNQTKSLKVIANDNYVQAINNNMVLGRYWSISVKWNL